jgi:hypothetical protein
MNPPKLNFHARINFAATHTTASLPCNELNARTRKGATRAGLSVMVGGFGGWAARILWMYEWRGGCLHDPLQPPTGATMRPWRISLA